MSTWPLVQGETASGPLNLLAFDPALLAAVPESERELARRLPLATRHRLETGPMDPAALAREASQPSALLMIEGVLVRDFVLAGRTNAQLFGPGNLVYPWREPPGFTASVPHWTVGAGGASVAVLDDRFARASHKWPGLAIAVQERLAGQLDAGSLRMAIVSLPHADQRILALLWQLAEQWGTVTKAGVAVHLSLTHELIGRLVGARRPTVSLALQRLSDQGYVSATGGRTWRLAHESYRALEEPEPVPLAATG